MCHDGALQLAPCQNGALQCALGKDGALHGTLCQKVLVIFFVFYGLN